MRKNRYREAMRACVGYRCRGAWGLPGGARPQTPLALVCAPFFNAEKEKTASGPTGGGGFYLGFGGKLGLVCASCAQELLHNNSTDIGVN